ncbi:phosphopantetheine adenylyltransferase [Natrarchaeobaculum aegyptiacum]|uniref:Phosphopantetheine adenylyltransferase n=1 Tax=Natrarchaeobaculum aegyptiacum TaxID=745377 RepID=A0A2Z2HUJ5_9EURY|nr:pantetheine-phosphate adenylyltransferase [Natrarchaeobaculum aegyptiacum]ARS90966.1 phosphopantetheine adenylyltransferase [Natrarchaeobaculum aegyptiacum]
MRVAVAGTFGPIHDGHRRLFERALEVGTDGVVVALTSEDLAEQTRHEPRPIPPLAERRERVCEELSRLDRWDRDVELRTLESPLGIASTDPDLDALVVSPETVGELEEINDRRREAGLEPVTGIVVPYVLAEDGERLSSTRVVRGDVDDRGRVLE